MATRLVNCPLLILGLLTLAACGCQSPKVATTSEPQTPSSPRSRTDGHPGSAMEAAPASEIPTSRTSYAVDGNTIEVAGICRLNDDKLECWDAQRNPAPDVATLVKKAFESQMSTGGSYLQAKVGKKNRLVIFRTKMDRFGMANQVDVLSVGDKGETAQSYVNFGMVRPPDPGSPLIQYTARGVAANPASTVTHATLTAGEYVRDAKFDCKVGSTQKVSEVTITLDAIEPFKPSPGEFTQPGMQGHKQWRVRFTYTGDRTMETFTANLLNQSGDPYRFANADGKGLTSRGYNEAMAEKKPDGSSRLMEVAGEYQQFFTGLYAPGKSRKGELTILIPVDPATISKISFDCRLGRTVELTDIPLDPH